MRRSPETVRIDVSLLNELEDYLAIDMMPPPNVLIPLMRRQEAQYGYRVSHDPDLEAEITKALDGEWLYLEDIVPIQRLRGWNRLRYGTITVRVSDLRDVARSLGNLRSALDSECEDQEAELSCPGAEDILTAVKTQMAEDGTCGECLWCNLGRLWAAVDKAMWDGGVELGIEYRTTVLGQSVGQANYEVSGAIIAGYTPEEF